MFLTFAKMDDVMAVYGRVHYTDSTWHNYYTDFCQFRLATSAAAYCQRHNYLK
ncbi:MAG: hypothetical protein WB438_07105 [Candidatus Cybelea sp.]